MSTSPTLPASTADERELALLAELAGKRLELLMAGKGQVAIGLQMASEIVEAWILNPPVLTEGESQKGAT